jgi:hypothetical protein
MSKDEPQVQIVVTVGEDRYVAGDTTTLSEFTDLKVDISSFAIKAILKARREYRDQS